MNKYPHRLYLEIQTIDGQMKTMYHTSMTPREVLQIFLDSIKNLNTARFSMTKQFIVPVLFSILTITVFAGDYSWHAQWEPEGENEKLKLMTDVSDGLVEYSEYQGRKTVQTKGLFLYFDVSDDFAYQLDVNVKIEMLIYDTVSSEISLHYDSMTENGRVSYRNSNSVKTAGDNTFKTITLNLPGAWFAGGENHGADFRLVIPHEIAVSKIQLYAAGLKDRQFDSKERANDVLAVTRYNQKIQSYNRTVNSMSDILLIGDQLEKSLSPNAWDQIKKYYDTWLSHKQLYNQISALEYQDMPADNIDSVLAKAQDHVNTMKSCYSVLKGKDALFTFFRNLFIETIDDTIYYCTPSVSKGLPADLWTVPANSQVNSMIEITACRDEYESSILGIISLAGYDSLTVDVSDLKDNNGNSISARNIDIKVVEHWYQAGQTNETKGPKQLIPELLVHDDSLVEIDLIKGTNILNFKDEMPDSQNLRPFSVKPLENKHLWCTFYVPQNTPAGIYTGSISINTKENLNVPVMLTVNSFDLKDNPKIASMYFSNHKWSKELSKEQYTGMLIDMKQHGLDNPTLVLTMKPDGSYDLDVAREELALRQRLDMTRGPLLTRGWYNVASYLRDSGPVETRKEKLKETVDTVNTLAKDFGYTDAYIYAIDEAAGDQLAEQVPVFEYVDEIGGKVWSAVLSDFGEVPGAVENMQMPNYSGIPPIELTNRVHQAGNKMIRYSYPQSGAELPWLWRYHFGLILWENEIDGGCTWTYRGAVDDPWNDFDCTGRRCSYRDFMMTYPGVDEPVSTIQWEAYREACDDLRYMHTLETLLENKTDISPELLNSIRNWLSSIKKQGLGNTDPNTIKKLMIYYIEQLTNAPKLKAQSRQR